MQSSTRAGDQRNPAPKALRMMTVNPIVTVTIVVVATVILIVAALIVITAVLLIVTTMLVRMTEELMVIVLDVMHSFLIVENQDQ